MRIHWEKDQQEYEGELNEQIFQEKIFPIFIEHLKPIDDLNNKMFVKKENRK